MREVRWVIVAAMAVLLWWSTPATALECPDGMALVPAGETVVDYQGQMWGGDVSETVWVDEFCIDIYEASQPDATAESFGSWIRGETIPGATSRAGVLPWVLISWNEAKVACAHAGKRLPTLAEWQTAFSGYGGADWPWGSDEYDETQAAGCYINYSYCDQFPTGGCCYENCAGDQCFTTCDMVGNVSEWVDGYWNEECYGDSQVLIAGGAAGGGPYGWGATNFQQAAPVIQMGCWWFVAYAERRFGLHHHDPNILWLLDDGFRCAGPADDDTSDDDTADDDAVDDDAVDDDSVDDDAADDDTTDDDTVDDDAADDDGADDDGADDDLDDDVADDDGLDDDATDDDGADDVTDDDGDSTAGGDDDDDQGCGC